MLRQAFPSTPDGHGRLPQQDRLAGRPCIFALQVFFLGLYTASLGACLQTPMLMLWLAHRRPALVFS